VDVAALAGGVGGAKLLVGLQRVVGEDLTAIVNTGDDTVIYGVHVSPDIDIVTYWLAGIADETRGWGILDDTFDVVAGFADLGVETWFSLGDRDLATCLYRTERLAVGAALSAITDDIRTRLGVRARVLPMTDDQVATRIVTADGRTLEFQEYFVKERCAPEVAEIRFAGIASASPTDGVIAAIERADRVVVCPSNPLLSVGPILALNGVRAALRAHPHVIAVSPIVAGVALRGPADRLLRSSGRDASASAVATMYEDFVDAFVIDEADLDEAPKIEAMGIDAIVTRTVMTDRQVSEDLARTLLA
jgi:LPPG:FO 2-phospho-L-lactate transferase